MKVAVVCFVEKEGSIVMYSRWSEGDEWTVLGWHLEEWETIVECAIRETYEEANIVITDVQIFAVQELMVKAEKYIVFYTYSLYKSWQLEAKEPQIKWLRRVKNNKIPKDLYKTLELFFDMEWVHILKDNIFKKWRRL